ncbi:MAG: amidase [Halioglobus sp.]|jgi:amidase
MPINNPNSEDLDRIAKDLGLQLSATEISSYEEILGNIIGGYNAVAATPADLPSVKYPRSPAYRPQESENPHNAWAVKTSVKGAAQGKLAGRTIVLKDNICLAGIPMTVGSSVLDGYLPEVDAEVACRILDAGGEITGKAVCEYFCVSSGSHTSATGPVHNPHQRGHTTGGSSSGCAALVAAGEVDMAIGGDQGGSIRAPSAFCGVYGMKPTFGLVPYTGCMPLDMNMDHIGPMTNSVEDNALLLEVIAGSDNVDPRQKLCTPEPYSKALGQSISGLKIAVLEEGFNQEDPNSAVDKTFLSAIEHYKKLGVEVDRVSVPMHLMGPAIFLPIAIKNFTDLMCAGGAHNTEGWYVPSMAQASRRWMDRPNDLPHNVRIMLMAGKYLDNLEGYQVYTNAQNLKIQLRAHYDKLLLDYDLLIMPTVPTTAPELPPENAGSEVVMAHALGALVNTMQFDLTGHPAMSIPCGMIKDLPVGMMLVGKHLDEATIYRAAHAFEQSTDWKSL